MRAARRAVSDILTKSPIVAVLRAADARDYGRVVDVLVDNGIHSIELTLSTPGTLEYLPALLARLGSDVEIGIGTVVSREQAQRALDCGAHFLVTPIMDLDVIALAVQRGVPVFPGGLTPTELHAAWEAGATAVKIFPAETVGPKYGSHLRGPFPELEFIPSGGVELDDIQSWLGAGAVAVSLGGPLVGDSLRGGSMDALAQRAQKVVCLVADLRAAG
ncbi:MAG: bifunctional 4-hydroxy-2-oxoglutarate aldolase/2-dehydro-3-deoxy-phosphogluconate aldolase [Actinomycetota bacterium]|nr:bifunctional 4-hydroxy-2-oxoglutarate aldolase/2-dehydro-3-deoxy-phosphogluconate aldolase [Actinomycetota bacterium]